MLAVFIFFFFFLKIIINVSIRKMFFISLKKIFFFFTKKNPRVLFWRIYFLNKFFLGFKKFHVCNYIRVLCTPCFLSRQRRNVNCRFILILTLGVNGCCCVYSQWCSQLGDAMLNIRFRKIHMLYTMYLNARLKAHRNTHCTHRNTNYLCVRGLFEYKR